MRRASGVGRQDPLPRGGNGGAAQPGANWQPERGAGREGGGSRSPRSRSVGPSSTAGVRAAAGQSEGEPGRETPAPAASLTCPTFAPRPGAWTPPGRFLSCGTQPWPPPEPRNPRVERGPEAGKAASGPEPWEAYIGGKRGTREGSSLFAFLTGTRQRFPGTASRPPRPAAPGPSPAAPPSSGRVSGGSTPPPCYWASAILLGAGRGQCACVFGVRRRPAALRREGCNAQPR